MTSRLTYAILLAETKERRLKPTMESKKSKQNERIIETLEKARGDRSYREYAEAAGVSTSSLIRIARGDFIPSPAFIRKLTADQARPEGGVTFEEMMAAAGHQELSYVPDWMIGDKIVEIKPADSQQNRLQGYVIQQYENRFLGDLCVALLRKGYSIGKLDDRKAVDFSVSVQQGRIKAWNFEAKYIDDCSAEHKFSQRLIMMFGQLMLQAPDPEQKMTIVVNSEDFFTRLKGFVGRIPYRGDLSVILYDYEKGAFMEEKYLSHYYEDETEEFFLV